VSFLSDSLRFKVPYAFQSSINTTQSQNAEILVLRTTVVGTSNLAKDSISLLWGRNQSIIFIIIIIIIIITTIWSTAQLGPWTLQSFASRHLYPLPIFSGSCISTPPQPPCPLYLTISLWTFQVVFSLLYILSVLSLVPFHPPPSSHDPSTSLLNLISLISSQFLLQFKNFVIIPVSPLFINQHRSVD